MKAVYKYLIFLFSVAVITQSCETDFELNSSYKAIPVVYGLIDQTENELGQHGLDTQYVKINKSFIGSGNNTDYASINDSVLFTSVSARIEEHLNGSIFNSYPLEELWVDNLDEGLFYEDSQKVYYFVPTSPLNDEATYKLIIETDEGTITSETELIGDELNFETIFIYPNQPIPGQSIGGVKFVQNVELSTDDYITITPSWNLAENAKRYELQIKFNYIEVRNGPIYTNRVLYWYLGDIVNPASTEAFKIVSGAAFYDMINSRLSSELSILERQFESIEFIITACNEDLNTYIEVNEPVTGVVTEKPLFTNINGGLGIFASKFSKSFVTKLSMGSLLELCKGPKTIHLYFCSNDQVMITAIQNQTTENCGCTF